MMIARMIAGLFALAVSAGSALAQNCGPYPNTLTNGQPADANQVMANFNAILNCVNSNLTQPLQGYIAGLTMSNGAVSPNTAIDTTAGVTVSDDTTTLMKIAAFTKNTSAAWLVGSGNGCLDSGSSLATNAWYHLFVITRTDTGVVDVLCSTSASSPTMPASYTKKRRIGSFKTDGSANIVPFLQNGDMFTWKTPVIDVNAANPGTAAVTRTLTVPTGVRIQAYVSVVGSGGADASGNPVTIYLSDLSANDISPTVLTGAASVGVYTSSGAAFSGGLVFVFTNTSAQIRSRLQLSAAGTSLFIGTIGWRDRRGQDS